MASSSGGPGEKLRNVAAVVSFAVILILVYFFKFQKEQYTSEHMGHIRVFAPGSFHKKFNDGCAVVLVNQSITASNRSELVFDCNYLAEEHSANSSYTDLCDTEDSHAFLAFHFADLKYETVTFDNIYPYYDAVISRADRLRRRYPCATPVWVAPKVLKDETTDLFKIHNFVRNNVLSAKYGVIIVHRLPIPREGVDVETTRDELYAFIHGLRKNLVSETAAIAAYNKADIYNSTESLESRCGKLVDTRKYDEGCMPPMRDAPLAVLITSLGGSGTHVISYEMCKIGLDTPHEKMGVDGSVSWHYAGNDWYINFPYTDGPLPTWRWLRPRFRRVIHVVRSPMKTISSVTGHAKRTYKYLYAHMNKMMVEPKEKELLAKAVALRATCNRGEACNLMESALFWVYWNRHIAQFADSIYKVDELQAIVEDACIHSDRWNKKHGSRTAPETGNCTSKLRDAPRTADQCAYQLVGTDSKKRAHDNYSWQQLQKVDADVAEMVRIDALKYGFPDLSIPVHLPQTQAVVASPETVVSVHTAAVGAANTTLH